MRRYRMLALGATLLAVIAACSSGGSSKPTIKIGSVGFDEARVMAEVYAQALEANGYTIDRAGIGLGARPVVAPAIESGQIELQPEYIGSRVAYYGGTPTGNSDENLTNLNELAGAKGLTALNYTPAIDTNAFVVTADTAAEHSLTTIGDLAAVQGELNWGLPEDCPTNPLCGAAGGALEQYGITADTVAGATLLPACDTPMAEALRLGTIDVAELCSTQPDIIVNGWVILEDDLSTQPADNMAPLIRNDLLAKVDRATFDKILNDVSARIDTTTLANLYKQVAVDQMDPADVARAWLQANGFVQAPSAT
ncbi:MAG TPA: ABC transporter substrate-binding protein [Candidatus Limnocylindrales bacterium]|jgi:osmoprotectant transport system substrate-binding protein|nr:ABC transporter substrate-binding protein [Candidatus Limnocylindrales bacterium]